MRSERVILAHSAFCGFGFRWRSAGVASGVVWCGGGFAPLVDFKAVYSAVRGSARFGYRQGVKPS